MSHLFGGTMFVCSASPIPHPSRPYPCNMPQAKTEVALQFLESCAAEVALQHLLFCNAEVIFPKAALHQMKNCTATKKQRCRKVALSCRFPADFEAPTCRHPRLGPADLSCAKGHRHRTRVSPPPLPPPSKVSPKRLAPHGIHLEEEKLGP